MLPVVPGIIRLTVYELLQPVNSSLGLSSSLAACLLLSGATCKKGRMLALSQLNLILHVAFGSLLLLKLATNTTDWVFGRLAHQC